MYSFQESNVLENGLLTPSEIQEQTPVSHNSNSDNSSIFDERKRRRMISNRASARRSRWRKKIHLETLTEQLNRLRVQKRELKTKLGLILGECHIAERENEQLKYENYMLLARLLDLSQILAAMQQH